MIPIDEQIAYKKHVIKLLQSIESPRDVANEEAILASLQRLKAIESVQVPDEPTMLSAMRMVGNAPEVIKHVDTLLDLLKRERTTVELHSNSVFVWAERAEAAEATIAAMLKLGAEPSDEMMDAGYGAEAKIAEEFKAMFAKLIEQAGVKK